VDPSTKIPTPYAQIGQSAASQMLTKTPRRVFPPPRISPGEYFHHKE